MGRFKSSVILLAGILLIPAFSFAQFNNNTTSPYSRYGLGDLQPSSFGRTAAMGGASLASRNSLQINFANPASYTAVDSLAFLFEFGVAGKFSTFENELGSTSVNDINFRYFAMNFQITNWMATSLGLTPFSDVGYDVTINESLNGVNALHRYYGEGSLSRAYLGLAIEPIENLSLGVNLNYMFGSLNRNSEVFFSAAGYYNDQQFNRTRIADFGLSFGAQGTIPFNADERITVAAVFEAPSNYSAYDSEQTLKTLPLTSGAELDTLFIRDEEKGNIEFPLTYGAGISYVKNNRLEINLDYYHQAWSEAIFFGQENPVLTDLDKFAAGAEWIPDRFSIGSYLNRIAYRAGLKYEKSYLKLNNQQINDFGISFGVGLPVYRSNSTINISAEIGRKGTTDNNLVLENYAKFNLSVNLYDLWFIQRRYD